MARRRKCAWCGDMFTGHAEDRHCSQSCGVKAAYQRLGRENWRAAVEASVASRKRKAYARALAAVKGLITNATPEQEAALVTAFRAGYAKGWMVHYDKVRLAEQRQERALTEVA